MLTPIWSQHLESTSGVNISSQHLMSIFQLDFPFLMPSISQYLEFNIYDCYFWVGFPVSAVKYFSKFGILHLRLHFWAGFPISAVKYFSKLNFCIYDWTFGVDFPFPLLSISQYLKFCIYDCTFGLDFPFPLLSISQYLEFCIHDCTFGLDFPFLLNGQTVQKYWGLAIFHTPWYTQEVWKIAKNQSHLGKG